MKMYGIRIFDGKNNLLTVRLLDILEEIIEGDTFFWDVLFLDGTPESEEALWFHENKDKINHSENGLELSWSDLVSLDKKFYQMFELVVLGNKTHEGLHRYKEDEKMYRSCDIVIELVDCAFWQIFSSKTELIKRLKEKFRNTEVLKERF